LAARGPGVMGMDVKIGNQFHVCLHTIKKREFPG
jgi:hypothetical protein